MRNHVALLVAGSLVLALASAAQADSGDIAIFTEAGGTDAITTADFIHDWDTTVRSTAGYSLDANGAITLVDGGHYLVMYNSRFDSTGGGNRSEVQSQLVLADANQPIGWSQGFIRRSSGADECITTGGGIINAAAGDPLLLRSFRTDDNGDGPVQREPAASGIQLLKLDDSWDYLRLSKTGDQAGPTSNGSFVDVTYDSQDELVGSSFAHTGGSADITLTTAGHYLVLANTYFQQSDNARSNFLQKLTLDDADVEGSVTSVYLRGGSSQSCEDGATALGMILETTADNQILNVEAGRESGASPQLLAGRTGVTIVKLPDGADFIRLSDSGSDDINPASLTALGWDTEDELDALGFTHNDSEIGAVAADDYLFLTATFDQDGGSSDRAMPYLQWRENGDDATIFEYGQTTMYDRDDGTKIRAIGNWAGLIDAMDAGDYVELVASRLGAGGNIGADSKGVQGVSLTSMFAAQLVWDGADPNAWMTDHWGGATPAGGEFHTVGSGTVQVQSDPPAAARLTITGGEVEVQTGWTLEAVLANVEGGMLDIDGQLNAGALLVGPAGAVDVAGGLTVGVLNTAGTNTISGGAIQVDSQMIVHSDLNMTGGTLDTTTAAVTLAAGTLTIDNTLVAVSLDMAGGALARQGNAVTITESLALSGSDLNMSGAALTTTGAAVVIATGRELTVDNQTFEARVLDLQGTLTRIGANQNVTVTESMSLGGGSLNMTGHTLNATTATVVIGAGQALTTKNQDPLTTAGIDLAAGGALNTGGNVDLIINGGGLRMTDFSFVVDSNGSFTAAWDDTAKTAAGLTLNGGMMTIGVGPAAASMYYSFNDAADPFRDDSIGQYHAGTPQATAPTWVAGGQIGGAVSFDANENGLRPSNLGFMEDECSQVTMAMWVQQDANAGLQTLVDEGGSTNGLTLYFEERVLKAAVKSGGPLLTLSSPDPNGLTPGWHHVATVFGRTPGLFELYVDGAVVDSNTFDSTTIAAHTDDPGIGYLQGSTPIGGGRYSGLMDELYYYEGAMDATEINDLLAGTVVQPSLAGLPVTLNADSGIMSGAAWPVQLGHLTIDGNQTLTLEGPGVSFSKTTLSGSSAVTIDSNTSADLGRDAGIDFGGGDVTVTKAGAGSLLLSQDVSNLGAGTSKFVAQEGTLALARPNLLGAAGVDLAGGELKLSAPGDDPIQTYNKPVTITESSTITAGKATPDANDAGIITYTPAVSIPAGKKLTLRATDGYTLNMAAAITGGGVGFDAGIVQLGAGAAVDDLSVGGTADVTPAAGVSATNMAVTGGTFHAGAAGSAEVVTIPESGVMTLGKSTYTATSGAFEVGGDITRDGAATIVLGGAGSELTVESPDPATFQGASIGNDTNTNFAEGGSMSAQKVNDPTYTITASGGDIWGGSDGCYFAYQEFEANQPLDISARVGGNGFVGGNNGWRKAGMMIRASLEANSRNGMTLIAESNGNGINPQVRVSDGAGTIHPPGQSYINHDTPVYLRLTYDGDGNTFHYYYKDAAGDDWTEIATGVLDVAMTDTIYAGLAVTSHNTSQQTTIDFDGIDGFVLDEGQSLTRLYGLTGEGTVVGDIQIAGELAPGDGIGTIATDSLAFVDGSALAIDVDGADCDLLTITGDLTIGVDELDVVGLAVTGSPSESSYTLIEWTGTLAGDFDDLILPTGYDLLWHDNGPGMGGSLEMVPEPATLVLLGLGGLAVLIRRKRK